MNKPLICATFAALLSWNAVFGVNPAVGTRSDKCSTCIGAIGHTSMGGAAEHIIAAGLPPVAADGTSARTEPWKFSMTIGFDGRTCTAGLVSGPPGRFADDIVQAMRLWQFRPFTIHVHGTSGPACIETFVYVYVRERNGAKVVIVPGVTEAY